VGIRPVFSDFPVQVALEVNPGGGGMCIAKRFFTGATNMEVKGYGNQKDPVPH
jgi:hypothetical protein